MKPYVLSATCFSFNTSFSNLEVHQGVFELSVQFGTSLGYLSVDILTILSCNEEERIVQTKDMIGVKKNGIGHEKKTAVSMTRKCHKCIAQID